MHIQWIHIHTEGQLNIVYLDGLSHESRESHIGSFSQSDPDQHDQTKICTVDGPEDLSNPMFCHCEHFCDHIITLNVNPNRVFCHCDHFCNHSDSNHEYEPKPRRRNRTHGRTPHHSRRGACGCACGCVFRTRSCVIRPVPPRGFPSVIVGSLLYL